METPKVNMYIIWCTSIGCRVTTRNIKNFNKKRHKEKFIEDNDTEVEII